MPTFRPADGLAPILRLGAALDVEVVVLCSGDAVVADILGLADRIPGCLCTAVALSDSAVLQFETSTFSEAPIAWHGDLSLKRNLGLLLGRSCGWRTVLFLDDDIRAEPPLVERAVGALARHAAVGMPAIAFPDNSVVGHARRLAFADQDVFVSGSALAVDVRRVDAFFPEIYNEDWLFLAPALERREVAALGQVQQLYHHDPYLVPGRAADEEFGDVIGEGLLAQLHVGPLRRALSADFWSEFLDRRGRLLASIALGCWLSDKPEASRAIAALEIAADADTRLRPRVLADYITAWREDLIRWRRRLAGVTPRSDLRSASAELGLQAETVGIAFPARRTGSG